MKTITAEQIMDLDPCEDYTLEKIKSLMDDLESVSAIEILDTDKIPDKDKIWLVLHKELLPELLLHKIGIFCAELVLPIWEKEFPEDDKPRLAIEAKKLWLNGEIDDKELDTTSELVRAATSYAARNAWHSSIYAAWVAWDSSIYAARPTAWAAASYAARAAAWYAAREAEREAEREAAWEAARDEINKKIINFIRRKQSGRNN